MLTNWTIAGAINCAADWEPMTGPSRGGTLKDAKTVILSRTANNAREMRGTRGLLAAAVRATEGALSRIEAAATVA